MRNRLVSLCSCSSIINQILLLARGVLSIRERPLTLVDLNLNGFVSILYLLDDSVDFDHRIFLPFLVLQGPQAILGLVMIDTPFPLLMDVYLNVSKFLLLLCEVIEHMILVFDIEIVT